MKTSHRQWYSMALGASGLLALAACDDKASKPPPNTSSSSPATRSPAPEAPTAPGAAVTGRDLSTLRACKLVTDTEVAKLAGGKSLSPARVTGPICIYVIERDDTTLSFKLAFYEPGPTAAMFAAMPASERGEKVDGPWDEAYLAPGFARGELALSAVWRGDVAMEVVGFGRDATVAIAKLAASRMPARRPES